MTWTLLVSVPWNTDFLVAVIVVWLLELLEKYWEFATCQIKFTAVAKKNEEMS